MLGLFLFFLCIMMALSFGGALYFLDKHLDETIEKSMKSHKEKLEDEEE